MSAQAVAIPIQQQINYMEKRLGIDKSRFVDLMQRNRMRPETAELEERNMRAIIATLRRVAAQESAS